MNPIQIGWDLDREPSLDKPSAALALTKWLIQLYKKGNGEGNDLLAAITYNGSSWPDSAAVDDQIRALVTAGWLERGMWCPDYTMARYVFPGAPKPTENGFYAAGYAYRPVHASGLTAFVEKWKEKLPKTKKPGPGDSVRLTPMFLLSTGQIRSSEAKRIWKIVHCTCSTCQRGDHVAVNESRLYQLEEYKADPEYCEHIQKHPWRHIALFNLKRA